MNNMRQLPVGQILIGDARERLAELPAESLDCVVTSPPYYLLRNYGHQAQLGAEDSVEDWVNGLLVILDQVARLLKPTGSVWLNVGDTYSRHGRQGAAPKGLLLGPERLVLALSQAGWSVRNKVIWAKTNPLPTSVRDRLSSTWEPLYLLTRSRRYYFDLDAIREPARSKLKGPSRLRPRAKYHTDPGARPDWSGPLAGSNSGLDRLKASGQVGHPLGKNPGDVWPLATAGYRGAHFATFPKELIERPIRATCPERVCATCGGPWWRAPVARQLGRTAVLGALRKSCPCSSRSWQPGVVADPFLGSGTTAVVAEQLGRHWLGVELSRHYARLARERIASARPGAPSQEAA